MSPARPEWDEHFMHQRTRRLWVASTAILVVVVVSLVIWVLFFAPITDSAASAIPVGADLFVVLAPILVAAIVVERLLAVIFNGIETSWRSLVAYLGYGMRWLRITETEVNAARQWLQTTSTLYVRLLAEYEAEVRRILDNTNLAPSALSPDQTARPAAAQALMQEAQKRLDTAENKLSALTDSYDYQRAKSTAAIVLGLVLGTIVADLTQMQVFALLGLGTIPARIDVLLSGVVIGSLSWPIRALGSTVSMGQKSLQEHFRLRQLELTIRQTEVAARQAELNAALLAATKATNITAAVSIGGDVTGRDKIGDTQIQTKTPKAVGEVNGGHDKTEQSATDKLGG